MSVSVKILMDAGRQSLNVCEVSSYCDCYNGLRIPCEFAGIVLGMKLAAKQPLRIQ